MNSEHTPWVGQAYSSGVRGGRIALAGYSHWLGPDDEDGPDVTTRIVGEFVAGRNYRFFSRITGFFDGLLGNVTDRSLWRHVAFFNFIPNSIGGPGERYAAGTAEQNEAGRRRVVRILNEHRPDKLIVFTTKGWRQFPDTIETAKGEALSWLDEVRWPGRYDWGTYQTDDGHRTRVFALRHPERANAGEAKEALREILAR